MRAKEFETEKTLEDRVREIVRGEFALLMKEGQTVEIGSTEIGRAAVEAINDLTKRTSKAPTVL